MIRQSDSHWQAFFIITDDAPFESRLQELLYLHHDPRLQYYHVPREFRKKVSYYSSIIDFHLLYYHKLSYSMRNKMQVMQLQI